MIRIVHFVCWSFFMDMFPHGNFLRLPKLGILSVFLFCYSWKSFLYVSPIKYDAYYIFRFSSERLVLAAELHVWLVACLVHSPLLPVGTALAPVQISSSSYGTFQTALCRFPRVYPNSFTFFGKWAVLLACLLLLTLEKMEKDAYCILILQSLLEINPPPPHPPQTEYLFITLPRWGGGGS